MPTHLAVYVLTLSVAVPTVRLGRSFRAHARSASSSSPSLDRVIYTRALSAEQLDSRFLRQPPANFAAMVSPERGLSYNRGPHLISTQRIPMSVKITVRPNGPYLVEGPIE